MRGTKAKLLRMKAKAYWEAASRNNSNGPLPKLDYKEINTRNKEMRIKDNKDIVHVIPYQTYTLVMVPCLRSIYQDLKKGFRYVRFS